MAAEIDRCPTAQVGCYVTAGIDGEGCLMNGVSNHGNSSSSVIGCSSRHVSSQGSAAGGCCAGEA